MARNLYAYHPVTGYRFIPGIKARVRHEGGGYLLKANQAGFRCRHEATPRKPDGVFRVLLFGDSYTAGEGVSDGLRFGDVLESLVHGLQVLNFGLPGSGTDQQYLSWREFGAELDCDLLLLCPMVENIRRNVQTHRLTQSAFDGRLVFRPKPYFVLDGGTLVLRHSPVPSGAAEAEEPTKSDADSPRQGVHGVLRDLTHAVDQMIPGFRCTTQRLRGLAFPREYNSPRDPAWMLLQEIFRRWVHETGAPVLICPIPTFDHIAGCMRSESYRARFAELGRELGVEVLDILPRLLSETRQVRREKLRFLHDEHPTPLCHRLIAEAIAPRIVAAVRGGAHGEMRQG